MGYTPYTLPLIIAAATAGSLAIFTARYRDVPGRTTFAMLMAAVAIWSAGYALEIGALDMGTKVMWAKVQYFGIAAIPVLWLRFVIHYAGESAWLSARRFFLLSLLPASTVVLAWLNDWLHLIWRSYTLDRSLGFPMLVFDYGPAFWLYAAYSYLLLLIGALVLLRAIVRLPRLGSRQGAVILFAALAPWVGNVLYLSGSNPFPLLDLTPFGFVLTGLAVAWGVGRLRFMGTVPVAHRAIIGGMDAGVVALDTEDNVVEINPAAERMFAVRADDVIGSRASVAFANHPEVIGWLTTRDEAHERSTLEVGGVARAFDIHILPLSERRRLVGRLITFHDIHKLTEAERVAGEAREQAESASRAKSEFLANVSHEIRTPLNAIMGMTALALEGELSPPQREYLQIARSSAESLLAIINDILDFSKIEVRKLVLDATDLDIYRVVDESLKMLAVTAAGKPIALRAQVAADVPRALIGDPLRVRQILVNLVSNAIKFTREGEIKVEVSRVGARRAEAGEVVRLRLAVSDTGIGISGAEKSRIFESFAQADASTTRVYGGTGLGLAIASHLIHLMNGGIDVDSEVGKGSTFFFTIELIQSETSAVGDAVPTAIDISLADLARRPDLELARAASGERVPSGPAPGRTHAPADAPSAPAAGAHDPIRLPPLSILIADDNVVNQKIARALLESRGHRTRVVGDGQEAIAALGEEVFDIVLMDVQMPRVDGLQATRTIRAGERWTGRHVPIIAITAHAMSGDRERFLEVGMDAYVPKPLDAALLFRTMAGLLDGENPPDSEAPRRRRPEAAAVVPAAHDQADPDPERAAPRAKPAGAAARVVPEKPSIDREEVLRKLGGDEELLLEVIDLYLEDAPTVLATIEAALGEGDAEGVWKSAHRLKGSVGSLSAKAAFEAARNLEMRGREGDLEGAARAFEALQREARRLQEALEGLRERAG